MEQNNSRKKKRGRSLLIFSNFLLCAALLGTVFFFWRMEYQKEQQVSTAQSETLFLRRDLDEAKEALAQLEDSTIPIETFKGYAQQYGIGSEFVQKFFNDVVVFKNETGIVYQPIDSSLPQNNYDWQNIVRENGRLYYRPADAPEAKLGVDVSSHQGDIDWKKVAADGIDYAILRVGLRGYGTNGLLKLDDNFEANFAGASKAGLPLGVYFYSQAITVAEAREEAQLVLEALKGHTLAYPIVFDQEEVHAADARTDVLTPALSTDIAEAFCAEIEAAGYRPMIYANTAWFLDQMEFSRLAKYDKWLAQYYRTPFFPYAFQMWQYTSVGKVDGIKGDVDLNLCFTEYPVN